MDIISTTRGLVGRRSTISRQEMADIIVALVAEGLDPRNVHVAETLPQIDWPTGMTHDEAEAKQQRAMAADPAYPARAARAWANACADITCISVGPGLRDGAIRYDWPGSMHPGQRAVITFVSATAAGADTAKYLRGHAKRVLVVRDDPLLEAPPGEVERRVIAAWAAERNNCPEDLIHATDSRHASRLGLAALSALHRLRADLQRAGPAISPREVDAMLAPVVRLATGEANLRLRAQTGDESIEVPGIPSYSTLGTVQ